MAGVGNRRDEGSVVINSTNVFAALESLRKKKKKSDRSSKGDKSSNSKVDFKEPEPQVFWSPTPLTAKSWADVDDEDDDDYYATTAPPPAVWVGPQLEPAADNQAHVEESESEEDLFDEGDDDVEEDHDHEPEVPVQHDPVVTKPPEIFPAPKEAERQLSKKERKKKELAELETLLADFGVTQKDNNTQHESSDAAKYKKEGQPDGDAEWMETTPAESKSTKKKKKKDKSLKEVNQPDVSDARDGPEETAVTGQAEQDVNSVDVKEKLKKMASMKKKKSSKEMDGAARAAAIEAAARSAKLAAAKKKEKNHYNQQPVR